MRLHLLVAAAAMVAGCSRPDAGQRKPSAAPVAPSVSWVAHDGTKDFPVDSSYSARIRGSGTMLRADSSRLHALTVSCDNMSTARGPGYTVVLAVDADPSQPWIVIVQLDQSKPDTMEWTPTRGEEPGETDLQLFPFSSKSSARFVARMDSAKAATIVYSNRRKPDTVRFGLSGLAPHVARMRAVCGS